MAIWKISTREKKSCEEREFWTKDGKTVVRINGFRWGTFTVETSDDNPPEGITEENPDGVDMYGYFGDNAEDGAELDSMDDGWYGDYEYAGFTDEEQEEIAEALDEADGHYEYLEENGWHNSETEAWLFGPLDIEQVG
jgi:hypothetical protein